MDWRILQLYVLSDTSKCLTDRIIGDGFPDMGVKNNASAVVNPRDVDMYAALKAKRPDGPYIMSKDLCRPIPARALTS